MAFSRMMRRAGGNRAEHMKNFMNERELPVSRLVVGFCERIARTSRRVWRSAFQIQRCDLANQRGRPGASAACIVTATSIIDCIDLFRVIESCFLQLILNSVPDMGARTRDFRVGLHEPQKSYIQRIMVGIETNLVFALRSTHEPLLNRGH